MKKTILFASALFAMLFTTTITAQAVGGSGGGTGGNTSVSCCPKFYVSTPSTTKGGKPTSRLLVSNAFKGMNRGVDLTYDIMDAKGGAIANSSNAISKNAAGDVVIDLGKLPRGKFRLSLKAGTATENYNF